MANDWRLLKTTKDIDEAIVYMSKNEASTEILVWDEDTKQAHVSKITADPSDICSGLSRALAWRPVEDEEKFKKFLAKLDRDYDAYILEFDECAEPAKTHALSAAIRESLKRELPFGEADYFAFSIIGYVNRIIILVDNTMSFDIPVGHVTRIQKTTPSYAAHDRDVFAKALKEQREKLEKRFFGADEND